MTRDEGAALAALRRWLAGDDAALEVWLRDPPHRPGHGWKSAEEPEDDRGFLESVAYAGA